MNLSDFRYKVDSSNFKDDLYKFEFLFNFEYINIKVRLTGLPALYEYVDKQIKGWKKLETTRTSLIDDNLVNYFYPLIKIITDHDLMFGTKYDLGNFINQIQSRIDTTHNFPLPYECSEVQFLSDVEANYPMSYDAAFNFLIRKHSYQFNNNESVIGVLLSYEFLLRDKSEILERHDKEKKSLNKLRSDYKKYIDDNEAAYKRIFDRNDSIINDHDKRLLELHSSKETELDELKIEKRDELAELYANHDIKYQDLIALKNKEFDVLEATYKEKLKLSEPAEYWKSRAEFLKRQGWMSLGGLIILVLIGVVLLYNLLWNSPEEMLTCFFGKNSNPAHAIRWSIVFVSFISFLAFAIRALYKVTFSSFHLARDAEERYTLTYFYLSLIKDSEVSTTERELIIQSLFSRADTGLLKDDSGPTMPGVSSIIGQKFGQN